MEEEYEYGLTRGTCFGARRLEVVAVAGLVWIYSVVCFGCGGIFFVFFFSVFFFFERTRPAASMRTPCIIYLSTSYENEARPFFAYRQNSLFTPGCVQGAII